MNKDWGYHLLGLCSVLFGGVTLAAHEFGGLALGNGAPAMILLSLAALLYIVGGVLVQIPPTIRVGAGLIGVVFIASAVIYLRAISAHPDTLGIWDGLFERLGVFSGAFIVFVRASAQPNPRLLRAAMFLFGICVVVYTLVQVVYLSQTAADVPKWIPPSQMFWAIATTVAFGLAAVSILTGWRALLASKLLTLMILIFGVTIWVPSVWTHPSSLNDWSEFGWNFAIAGAAWILADWLRARAPIAAFRTAHN